MSQRNIGGGGEHFFKAWCNMVGIVANASDSDMHGWDLLIEVDQPGNVYSALTVHQGNMEAKVQIKSTDGSKKNVDVELSNLWKMSTTLLPAFYVLIEFDNKSLPVRGYVKHVDEELIGQVLERVTKLVGEDSAVKLNKRKMRIKFDAEFSIQDPLTLKVMLGNYMGLSSSRYSERKKKWLELAGFEGGGYKVSFTISNLEQLEKFADASLGKNVGVGVEVEAVHGSLVRFGLSTSIPHLSASTAILSLLQVMPDEVGKVTIRDRSTGKSFAFDADLYRGGVNGFLPKEQRKIRIDARLFEVNMRYGLQSINIAMTVGQGQEYNVVDLLKVFSLFNLLKEPNGLEMSLGFFGLKPVFVLKNNDSPQDFTAGVSVLKSIVDLKNYFEFSEPLMLKVSEIESRFDYLCALIARFANVEQFLRLSFTLASDFVLEVVDCFYIAFVRLGKYLFFELILLTGPLEKDEERDDLWLKVESSMRVSLYKTVVEYEDKIIHVLKEDVDAVLDNYESSSRRVDFTPLFFDDALGASADR